MKSKDTEAYNRSKRDYSVEVLLLNVGDPRRYGVQKVEVGISPWLQIKETGF